MTRSRTVVSTLTRKAGAALALCAGLAATPASDTPMLFTRSLGFATGTQSLWGPGGSTASFGASGSTSIPVGSARVGAGFSAGASSGTASASLNGTLSASYASEVTRARRRSASTSRAPARASARTSAPGST